MSGNFTRIRDAQTIIGMLEHGELNTELSQEITGLLAHLKSLTEGRKKAKAKGSVTLKLDFLVEEGTVTISPDIAVKKPKPPRGDSFYFLRDDGSISTQHPQQEDMFAGPRAARMDTQANA